MQLCATVVVFAASLPHAVVRHPVGSFHTEHQVLDEGNLHTENTHQTQEGMGQWEWMQTPAHTYTVSYTNIHTQMRRSQTAGLQVVNMFPY